MTSRTPSASGGPRPAGPQAVPAASVALYRQLVEAAPDAIVVVDADGTIVLANHGIERMFGYTRAELIGRPLEVLLPQRYVAAHERHRRRFFVEPEARPMGSSLELFARRSDGSEFPAEVALSAVRTRGGVLAAAAVRDVTERIRMNAALREAEEKFRSTFESAGVGMALTASSGKDVGRIVDANEALGLLVGLRHDELVGMEFIALHDPESRDRAVRGHAQLCGGELQRLRYECQLRNVHDERVWAHVTSTIVVNDAGDPHFCLHQVSDIRERKRLEQQLRHLADHDPLTDLLNRRGFLNELESQLAAARRYGRGLAVMLMDLDQFKYVNDSLGHLAGDALIQRAARVLRHRLRNTDTLARLGGDEFAVILAEARPDEAQEVASVLIRALRGELRTERRDIARPITASIGIAPLEPGREVDAMELLNEADIAMYDAKEAGGDRHALYEPNELRHRQMNVRLNQLHTIRRALSDHNFVLHAQPIVSLKGDPRPRYELLIRLVNEHGELIRPDVFLPVADSFGLARDIDAWVTERAAELLIEQRRAGREISLAVNLSANSITDGSLLEMIRGLVASAQIDPRSLCFELTETAAIGNVDSAHNFARGLAETGCEFALDDFGNGYASFYYVKHMQFDYLKIDGEFIRGLLASSTDQVIVRSVVQMARGLGKKTIAEFVEDEATLRLLQRDGVDYAQGLHIGAPAPLDVLDAEKELGAA